MIREHSVISPQDGQAPGVAAPADPEAGQVFAEAKSEYEAATQRLEQTKLKRTLAGDESRRVQVHHIQWASAPAE